MNEWELCIDEWAQQVKTLQAENVQLKAELAEATKHASWPVSICVGCGATTGFKNIVYDTPGEPVDYDMECTTCGSREIDEGRASRLVERCERAEAKLEAYEAIPQDKDGTPFAAASAWRAECNRIKEQLEEHKQREARVRTIIHDAIYYVEHSACNERIIDLLNAAIEEAGA